MPDVWKLVRLEGGRVVPPKQGWGDEMYTVKYTAAAVYTPHTKESKKKGMHNKLIFKLKKD